MVWEFRSPHRAGARGELVATLFDLVRYEATTPFLAALTARSAAATKTPTAAQAP